ncbi:hypothetical protein KAR91_83390 [Candidatus Pacearchaeota archaeon]|nr:hypothetical protein [Candidatus Pacearchaeota archaeon]
MKFYWDEKRDCTLRNILLELGKQYSDSHNNYGPETKEGKNKIYNLLVIQDAFELIDDDLDLKVSMRRIEKLQNEKEAK